MINDMRYKLYLQMYTKKVKKGGGGSSGHYGTN